MALNTPIAALPYPELTDIPNAQTAFQNLATALDTKVIPKFATSVARDAAIPSPVEGMVVYRTDINGLQEYNGGWKPANVINCTSGSRPSSPETGRVIYETDTKLVRAYDGASWVIQSNLVTSASKSVDTTRANSAVYTDDPHLTLPVVANAVYRVEVYLVFVAGGGMLSTRFTFPASATLDVISFNWSSASATLAWDTLAGGASPVGAVTGLTGTDRPFIYRATLHMGATAGNIVLQWGQGSSNASGAILRKGSNMTLTRIAS